MLYSTLKKFQLIALALALSTACTSQDAELDRPTDGTALVRTALSSTASTEAAYAHRLYLIEENQITQTTAASSAAALDAFRVAPGSYGLLAVAADNEDNLTFPATQTGALSAYAIQVKDLAQRVPDLLIGRNANFEVGNSGASVPVELSRVVSYISVKVLGLGALAANTITVKIPNMYDCVAADGTPSNSGTGFSEKTLTLTKDQYNRYAGAAIIMPTDLNAQSLAFEFSISGKTYTSVQNVHLEADKMYDLTIAAQFADDTALKLTPVLSYAPWDSALIVNDSFSAPNDDRPVNAAFTVEIQRDGLWQPVFVHKAVVSDYAANPSAGYKQYDMGFVMFTDNFENPVKVRVTRNAGNFSSVAIRPSAYKITPTAQTANSVEFELTSATQKVSVEFDGNRMENLFVLPDQPDTTIPTGANVTYFGPGIHNIGLLDIRYKNDQTIYLAEGALVYGRIFAKGCKNLSIRGRGIFCASKESHGDGRKPQIETFDCDNFSVEGIMLRDTPNWTFKIVGSTGVHIDNIKEIGWVENSDGMDFICCRNVLVENTFQRNYDDNVTIKAFNGKADYVKAHTNADGSYSDAGIGNVFWLSQNKFDVYGYEIRNCVFWADKGHNMLVGPESRGIPFNNIKFHHNTVLENRQNDAVYPGAMALMIADNGTFENVSFEDITVEDINGGKVFCAQFSNAFSYGGLYGQWMKTLTLKNIAYTGTRATKSWIRGRNDTQCIDSLTISNFTVNGTPVTNGSGSDLEINGYVKNVNFQ